MDANLTSGAIFRWANEVLEETPLGHGSSFSSTRVKASIRTMRHEPVIIRRLVNKIQKIANPIISSLCTIIVQKASRP
jgi:hypothetical protein